MGKMTDFRGEKRQSDDRSVQSEDGEGEQELPSRRPGEPRRGTAPRHPSAAAGPPGTPSPLPFHLISFCLSGAGGCCSGRLCVWEGPRCRRSPSQGALSSCSAGKPSPSRNVSGSRGMLVDVLLRSTRDQGFTVAQYIMPLSKLSKL